MLNLLKGLVFLNAELTIKVKKTPTLLRGDDMFGWFKKLWKINRIRIVLLAAFPMIVIVLSRVLAKEAAAANRWDDVAFWNSGIILVGIYMYVGGVLGGIFLGPKIKVQFKGRKKNKKKLVFFDSKKYEEIDCVWIMGLLIALPFVSGLIANGLDSTHRALIYTPFLMYHMVCFIKNIPLSTIRLLAYFSKSGGDAPKYVTSSDPNIHHSSSDSSNTVYNNTYTYGGFSSNYRR